MNSNVQILSKIGIIGDVHAETTNLSIALSYLEKQSLQAILCVGDIVDGPESVDACCALLQKHNVLAVRGNHDNWFAANEMRSLADATLVGQVSLEAREYISSLPATRELHTSAGRLLLCHGIGNKDMGRITPDDYGYALEMNFELRELVDARQYRFMVNGHTHRAMLRRFDDLTIINPGTLKRCHEPCFGIVDFDAGIIQTCRIVELGCVEKGEAISLADVKPESIAAPSFRKW